LRKVLSPAGVRPPFGRYSQAVCVPAGARFVFCSGQLGVKPDDSVPGTVDGQTEQAFRNIEAVLAEDGMTLADVVRINAYVTERAHMKEYMAARDRFFDDPPPASTLMIVTGFSRPEFLVEVEVVAAKAD
jgi:2-iminobutanoate/2-iminopropanoate deaminase